MIPMAMQHFTLLERNLLYTGVTRGKQNLYSKSQRINE
ncbi:ATP-binding domain-containing protein [Endozoicomonas acroporae]